MPIDQGVLDSVVNSNMKTVGEAASFYQAQAMGNHIQSQNRLQVLAETALAKSVELLQTISMGEAAAENKVATGNDTAAQMMSLLAALNAGTQGVKATVNTPPVAP